MITDLTNAIVKSWTDPRVPDGFISPQRMCDLRRVANDFIDLQELLDEALSIIRSAQTNTVYEQAKAFIEKIESK